jgi:hypothetical protein
MSHTFHIPVLGLGFSIDTPLKVARYGISSVVSIVDDQMIERMREHHLKQNGLPYDSIPATEEDFRAKRITAYLDLLHTLISEQISTLKAEEFSEGADICKYFELLPDHLPEKRLYEEMLMETDGATKNILQQRLRTLICQGAVDVNIMSKVDKINYSKDGQPLGDKFSDALASLRGFAYSTLSSSIILSAGMNPRLYSYLEEFEGFFPVNGLPAEKKIILKVSDYRSAFIQAKFLAKKGLWVHEFRIESGLNCGGHAFATEGFLLGPILEEFKHKRQAMTDELFDSYQSALTSKGIPEAQKPVTRITVQGGIGTAEENEFLQDYYQLDGTGWGSPFLLVPEATNVDDSTLNLLATADGTDFYISGASPLGIPFNNFRKSTAEQQRLERIAKGRPGSPCTKKYLVSNTEFTDAPICTASREYQNLKIKSLKEQALSEEEYDKAFATITEKICLCEGLVTSAYIKKGMLKPRENKAVAICPGPNTAYFSGIYTLEEMVKHIYGKMNLLKNVSRPHVFVNELKLYVDYLKKDVEMSVKPMADKKAKQLSKFKEQLLIGVDYYLNLLPSVSACADQVSAEIKKLQQSIAEINVVVV